MNKRGQGLSLNTLIIAIIVVIVLVVIITIFLSGTSGLAKSIRDIFGGTTAGTDKVIAIETCNNRCSQAQSLPDPKDSAFCKSSFKIDSDPLDGKADVDTDGNYIKWYCPSGTGDDSTKYLGVTCSVSCT